MAKLLWKNLLENACPKCGDQLFYMAQGDKYMCSINCDFMMKRTSLDKMVAKLNKEEYEPEEPDFFEAPVDVMDDIGSNNIMDYQEDDE